jgi:hypothetical protein
MRDGYWLDIAHHLHIGPRVLDTLTVLEFFQACSAVDKIRAEAAKLED